MSNILKETKYLIFKGYDILARKTILVEVINKSSGSEIGQISWYSRWRQYCFFPNENTVWNKDCLISVNEVLEMLNSSRITSKNNPVEYKIDSKPTVIE